MKDAAKKHAFLAALAERRAKERERARIARGGERIKAQEKLVAATAALLKAEVQT